MDWDSVRVMVRDRVRARVTVRFRDRVRVMVRIRSRVKVLVSVLFCFMVRGRLVLGLGLGFRLG